MKITKEELTKQQHERMALDVQKLVEQESPLMRVIPPDVLMHAATRGYIRVEITGDCIDITTKAPPMPNKGEGYRILQKTDNKSCILIQVGERNRCAGYWTDRKGGDQEWSYAWSSDPYCNGPFQVITPQQAKQALDEDKYARLMGYIGTFPKQA